MFTAIAILQLEAAGKLHTQDTITAYFDNAPDDKAAITLNHILFHNAGLVDFVAGDDFTPIGKAEAIQAILNAPLLFTPGEEWSYSNAGYSLLAAIIEQISGESYTEYLHKHIFEPANMATAGFYGDERWEETQVAHGYINGRNMESPRTWPGPYWGIMGNGGIVASVNDMAAWDQALRSEVLLDKAGIEQLYTPRREMGDFAVFGGVTLYEIYGGGLLVRADGSRIVATTGGNDYGFVADYARYIDDEITVIVLTNHETISAPLLGRELVRILHGEEPAEPASLHVPEE